MHRLKEASANLSAEQLQHATRSRLQSPKFFSLIANRLLPVSTWLLDVQIYDKLIHAPVSLPVHPQSASGYL